MTSLTPSTSSSTSQWPQTPSSIASPEERVNRIEQDAYAEADRLPIAKRETYKTSVRRDIARIRSRIADMRARGRTEYAINRVIDGLVQDFYSSKVTFIEQNGQFQNNKAKVQCRTQAHDDRIQQCRFRTLQSIKLDKEEEPKKYPSQDALKYCLKSHPLTNDSYLEDKKVLDTVGDLLCGEEIEKEKDLLIVKGVVIDKITGDEPKYIPIVMNVMQALEDCSKHLENK